ncbi:hypothetical protein IKZ80_06035, partial [bacterium]|nr:hypothetical protein [bacterium]
MKRSLLVFGALVFLFGCDKKAFDEKAEENLQVVPVVLRETGAKTTVAKEKTVNKLANATVVTVTVFQASAQQPSVKTGSQLISLPIHT